MTRVCIILFLPSINIFLVQNQLCDVVTGILIFLKISYPDQADKYVCVRILEQYWFLLPYLILATTRNFSLYVDRRTIHLATGQFCWVLPSTPARKLKIVVFSSIQRYKIKKQINNNQMFFHPYFLKNLSGTLVYMLQSFRFVMDVAETFNPYLQSCLTKEKRRVKNVV